MCVCTSGMGQALTFSAFSKAQALIKVLQAVSNFSSTCTQSA